MRYLCSFIFCFALLSSVGFAQKDTTALNAEVSGQTAKMNELLEKLHLRQDSRITDLLESHLQYNQRHQEFEGFRLEIYFGSESKARERAVKTRNEFNLIFPKMSSYLTFQTPNFKVRVGDFRSKSEALKAKAYIASKYPNAFIVKDMIKFPELFPEPEVEESEEQ